MKLNLKKINKIKALASSVLLFEVNFNSSHRIKIKVFRKIYNYNSDREDKTLRPEILPSFFT